LVKKFTKEIDEKIELALNNRPSKPEFDPKTFKKWNPRR